ncbi:hypothetical protein TELCIR_09444 [Teladorsagia circumcincta]|uniref:HEAT repeat protein n=1 Tax=Teladorsagia circumcincta TaxID=45464 RepID=A0A2G9UEZ3_TELCI|nr:hypothetical protein TELCIR_09444 [Teladorsagia circumcincta]
MNYSVAKSSEQRVSILEGVARCADAKNASSSALEKVANGVILKTTSPDKEGEMKALPAESEKQLWQEFDAVLKEPLQFVALSLLLLKSTNAGTANHSKVWEKVSVYDGVLKDRSLSAMSTDDAFAWIDLTEKMILERPISNSLYAAHRCHMNYSVAKSSEQRVSILEGVARCADAKNASSSALEKVANGVILKTTSPDKEGEMKALPAESERQLWQEFDAVLKEPLQFVALSLLLLKSTNAGTANHSKVWEKVSVYDGVLKDRSLSAMSTDDAFAWIDLTEKMILERPISNSPGSYPPMCLKSLAILLFWPHWQVRKRSSLALERILAVEESHFAEALADVIFTETINGFVDQTLRKVMQCHQDPQSFTVPGEWDNALITLVALNFPSVRDALWSHIEKNIAELDVGEYVRIPEKHVLIYQCSEGHLYNTEVLEFDEGEITYNMRRENKAYSFRDQLAEIQLRRELAEKKRKEGKLTAAQKQVMEKELAKEKVIRDEMRQMYVAAEVKIDEARAMVAADHLGAMIRTNLLFDYCIPLTRSHLVSKNAADLFFAYRDIAFPHTEDYLDELLGSTILRVIGAHWHVANWHDEPLNSALQRSLQLLNERAFVVETGDDVRQKFIRSLVNMFSSAFQDDSFIFEDIVGATQLTVLYPMIREILSPSSRFNDDIREATLTLLQNAIHRRFLKALLQLVSLANETEDTGPRVVSLARSTLAYLDNDSCDLRENVIKVLSAPQLLTRLVLSSDDSRFAIECLVRVFVARFDPVEAVAEQASQLWYASVFHMRPEMAEPLIDKCVSEVAFVRESAAGATAAFVQEFPDKMPALLDKLEEVRLI